MIFEYEGAMPDYAKVEPDREILKARPVMDERNVSMEVAEGKTFALPGGQGHGTGGTGFLASETEAEHLSKVGLAKRGGGKKPKADEGEGANRETKVVGPTERKGEPLKSADAHPTTKRK